MAVVEPKFATQGSMLVQFLLDELQVGLSLPYDDYQKVFEWLRLCRGDEDLLLLTVDSIIQERRAKKQSVTVRAMDKTVCTQLKRKLELFR